MSNEVARSVLERAFAKGGLPLALEAAANISAAQRRDEARSVYRIGRIRGRALQRSVTAWYHRQCRVAVIQAQGAAG